MILSFLALVFAALVGFALLPVIFAYTGWSVLVVGVAFLIVAWLLLCYVGHAQACLLNHLRKRRER